MGRRDVRREDALKRGFSDRLSFQEVVDVIIRDPVDVFIGPQRSVGLQIGGRHLEHQVPRRSEIFGERPHAPLGQSGKRQDVRSAVAEFREVASP